MARILPTSLSEKEILSYQKLYFQKYGEQISNELAEKEGLQLLHFLISLLEADIPELDDDGKRMVGCDGKS